MGKKKYLEIGQIVSTHGIAGEVRVKPWCDSPDVLTQFDRLFFDEGKKEIKVLRARVHKNIVIILLEGISDLDSANKLRNKVLYAAREDFDLPDDRYFIADLLGMDVCDAQTGEKYGVLTDVLQYGAADVYEIDSTARGKILVPAVPKEVIVDTDFEKNTILINMPKGLIDDEN